MIDSASASTTGGKLTELPATLDRQLERSREMLAQWAAYAENFWYDLPDRSELGCFGTGYNSWGVQTNQKYIGAVGAMAVDASCRDAIIGGGLTPEHLLKRALAALRYEIATHHVGHLNRTDGSRWGHTWISGLGIERMAHAVDALWPHMSMEDRRGFLEVLASEANWLLNEYTIGACLWQEQGPNRPESNLWNGAILLRAAMMMPGDSRAPAWTEKAHAFFLNSISVPVDADSNEQFLGRPLSQWHIGANFFPNYALDHHAYLNVGYMVICLSNVAMMHYAYALRGRLAPPAVYHHAHDLWKLVRSLVFADGRLLRIGGDSRIRYCYCQDYLLPTLVFAADHFADPIAPHLEAGQVNLLRTEQRRNGPGSFLKNRLAPLVDISTYYFSRLEADKAVCLAMQLYWRTLRPEIPAPRKLAAADVLRSQALQWQEPRHGAIMVRQPTRVASVSWRACEGPQVLCLPPDDGSQAEWSENLAGRVTPQGELRKGDDQRPMHPLLRATQQPFDGGFVTCGTTFDGAWINLAEGYRTRNLVRHHLAAAALPDGHSLMRLELARLAPQRAFFRDRRGFKINVPCDIFNGSRRKLYTATGSRTLRPRLDGRETLTSLASGHFNIDDRIAGIVIYGDQTFHLYRPGCRRGGLGGSIYYDEICLQATLDQFEASAGEILLDNGSVVMASIDHETTAAMAEAACFGSVQCTAASAAEEDKLMAQDCRAAWCRGVDGHTYLLVANFFLDEADTLPLPDETPASGAPAARSQAMAPDETRLRNGRRRISLSIATDGIRLTSPSAGGTGHSREAQQATLLATRQRLSISQGKLEIAVAPGEAHLLRLA